MIKISKKFISCDKCDEMTSVCQGVVLIAILFLKSIIDLTFDKFLGIIL